MPPLKGLIAAALQPFDAAGGINTQVVPRIVDHLLREGVSGLYVCGSTGEGISLTTKERMQVAEAYVAAAGDKTFTFVQVGHNSLREARQLAAHAESIQAGAISATCPNYFPVSDVETLVACMAEIADAAPSVPFFYYHIPGLTGSRLSMLHFLELAEKKIPTFGGLKYTAPELYEFQSCLEFAGDRMQMFWGTDEMLLPALATGADAAIGSTYNVCPQLYRELWEAYELKELDRARSLQADAIRMIDLLKQFPFHAALKVMLAKRMGLEGDLGGCRLPLQSLDAEGKSRLERELSLLPFDPR